MVITERHAILVRCVLLSINTLGYCYQSPLTTKVNVIPPKQSPFADDRSPTICNQKLKITPLPDDTNLYSITGN